MRHTIFNPLFWISIVFIFSLLVNHSVWKKRLKYLSLILFLLSTNRWVSSSVLHFWEYETIKANEITEPYDIGIVLGPFNDKDKYLPIRAESIRFTQALQLYQQNKFKKFLLSGNDNPELTRSHLLALCVPPEDILVEGKSTNTYENAVFSKRFLEQNGDAAKKLLLITSALHMRRARKCFAKVGLEVTPFSVDYMTADFEIWDISIKQFIPNRRALGAWEQMLGEGVSMVYFWWYKWI